MIEVLKLIKEKLEAAGMNYQFGEWKGAIKYPYFVGELQLTIMWTRTKKPLRHLFLTGGREMTGWNYSTLMKK